MSRSLPEVSQVLDAVSSPRTLTPIPKLRDSYRRWNAWLFRVFLISAAAGVTLSISPFGLHHWTAAGLGVALSLAILAAEYRLRRASITDIAGGVMGGIFGVLAALLVTLVISRTSEPEPAKSFVECASLLAFGYLGIMLGAQKAVTLKPESLPGLFRSRSASSLYPDGKLLDTSVLIDGRIAEICEAHFLDGPLLVPQFVLHELQMIADSADSLRRQRGRRGLEVLQRVQKISSLEVRIIEDNPSTTAEVDRKLVELAVRLNAKIVTNDFNLNKVASVQGIAVLNVNLLANAVRPAVLPGEGMRVFILREGKEANQGVAYLEDGTMVVVDGARRLINKTVDIIVTSVHQTPAGKMIFGRLDDRADTPPSGIKQAAAGARTDRYAES
jgi:uncharacterized protein YacL